MKFLDTFSKEQQYDNLLSTPFTEKAVAQLIGLIHRHEHTQITAASLTGVATGVCDIWQADFQGALSDLFAVVSCASGLPGPSESMVYDIQKIVAGATAATSILSTGFTVNSTNYVQDQMSFYSFSATNGGGISPGLDAFKPGDTFVALRSYTPGTSGTMLRNKVAIEPSTRKYK